jgi:hypothetical protein
MPPNAGGELQVKAARLAKGVTLFPVSSIPLLGGTELTFNAARFDHPFAVVQLSIGYHGYQD